MPGMNLADPQLEYIDPTPSVHALFVQFDKEFFSAKLASRAVVRWSKRMYSCAGICSYEGRGGLCDIALSEPLLKLRPRKDLVETLLHEMIHAFLFVTNKDQDRNGHGPNFQAHMHRINQSAGLNITIYHDFHDEVKLYLTHWWRCDGPCKKRSPYFGIVRRSNNRAPGPADYWWKDHKAKCGGTFTKIVSPEKKNLTTKKSSRTSQPGKITKNKSRDKTNIGKYLKIINKNLNRVSVPNNISTSMQINTNTPMPNNMTRSVPVFAGNGYNINNNAPVSDSRSVTEHVRNIWANKQISTKVTAKKSESSSSSNPNKHKADGNISSPAMKVKKIDEYFKANATLQDLYGQDYTLVKPHCSKKLVAVSDASDIDIIDCPVCNAQIDQKYINRHLDECLNKDIINELTNNNQDVISQVVTADDNTINDQTPIVTASNMNNLQAMPSVSNTRTTDAFVSKDSGDDIETSIPIKTEPGTSQTETAAVEIIAVPSTSKSEGASFIKIEPGTSRSDIVEPGTSGNSEPKQKCPCCGKKFNKTVEDHLDECLAFIIKDEAVTDEKPTTSINGVIVIDDDEDIFDESLTLNATGTKTPCPCCMRMVEQKAMNHHLDFCLGLWDD